MDEKFTGHWLLLPELCLYQQGEPPLSGTYVIRTEAEQVEFEIEWTEASGTNQKLTFGGSLDGMRHPSEAQGISHVSYEKIDGSTLDSTAYDGDKTLLYARRVVSSSGELLAVSQVVYGETGSYSNFQVYRRKGK